MWKRLILNAIEIYVILKFSTSKKILHKNRAKALIRLERIPVPSINVKEFIYENGNREICVLSV